MPSSICKCDKPLEPLSIYPTYSNSFYPLHLFLPFIHTQTFPFTNILHQYLLNTQLIFPQSFSLSRFFSLSLLLSLLLSIFSSTSSSLCLFASRPPSILDSFISCSSTPPPPSLSLSPLSFSLSLLPLS